MPRPRKARPPLTKRAIDAAKPSREVRRRKKTGEEFTPDRFLWDGQEHGLGVKITGAGSKIFILQKSVHGRLKRVTLGAYGDLSLDQARVQARRLNGEIAKGRDPVADAKAEREEAKRQQRDAKLVTDLWDRYWLEVVSPNNRPRTTKEKQYLWNSRIKPRLGNLRVKDVTEQEAAEVVHGALKLDARGRVIGGKGAAGNVYRLIHHMFEKALQWRLRPKELGNPLENVAEPKVHRRERLLAQGEVAALIKAVDGASEEEHETALAAIKLVLLTGARISEILGLQWREVRQEDLELHLRDTKSGFSRRPISKQAMGVITKVKRVVGCQYVFRSPVADRQSQSERRDRTGSGGGRPRPMADDQPIDYSTVRKTFDRIAEAAGVKNCTLHTVRHWFSTQTANAVSNPRVGMALTGHRSHAAYMNYVHADKQQARELADQLGKAAQSLARKKRNVVPLRKTA